ncbi:MAG TPA: aminotransferase, partial [Chryseosolibacter sp.]|nr:aminotransferase [Chryseosolibacter sp.]
GVLKPHQYIEIANPSIRALVESWTKEKLPLDKRFVYYLLAAKGVCVVPISSFCSELEGFRVTLLEEDEATLIRTFEAIRDGIIAYINS